MKVTLHVDPVADMRAGICTFCRRTVTDLDGCVQLFARRLSDDALLGPAELAPLADGLVPVACFAHLKCGPETAFWIAWDRLDRDATAVRAQIARRPWASPVYLLAIDLAWATMERRRAERERARRKRR